MFFAKQAPDGRHFLQLFAACPIQNQGGGNIT